MPRKNINKRKIIKDFFIGDYGSFQMETAFQPYNTIEEDLNFISKLNALYIKHKIISISSHGWEEVRYYGTYSCLKTLIETALSCGIKTEDDYILDRLYKKNDWI